MDIGMKPFDPSITFENLVSTGRLNINNMDHREMIATMDAILASLMSWLEGNSIAQTVKYWLKHRLLQLLTCVFLSRANLVTDPLLSSFSYGILELTTLFRHVIQLASVYEEVVVFPVFTP
ncbi:unnamed protein product [Gongylonema pulchrum]|uniref:Protein MAK10 homolog n=1 Tax=Gongylonema pulchrum TaxID=637853 RepID=A0A183DXC7_9BILA|nr:unnamed protein product [Gongylonema pulchrum]